MVKRIFFLVFVEKQYWRAPPPSPSHRPFAPRMKVDAKAEAEGAFPSVEPSGGHARHLLAPLSTRFLDEPEMISETHVLQTPFPTPHFEPAPPSDLDASPRSRVACPRAQR